MSLNTPFKDAVDKNVDKGSASETIPAHGQNSSPITNCCFKDAIETKMPTTRTGGLLPETQMDNGFSYSKPSPKEPGKNFKIG